MALSPEDTQELVRQLRDVTSRLHQLESQQPADTSSSSRSQHLSEHYPPEPKIAAPEFFDGEDTSRTRDFLSQLTLVFVAQPRRYASEPAKIAFAASRLRGRAYTWFRTNQESGRHHALVSYEAFHEIFLEYFGGANVISKAEHAIDRLSQGRRSVTTLAAEFQDLANNTKWNEEALMHAFFRTLNHDVKDELHRLEKSPETLAALINTAIKIDNRQFERRRDRAENSARNSAPYFPRHPTAATTYSPAETITSSGPLLARTPIATSSTSTSTRDAVVPMQIGSSLQRGPLPQTEKDRRRKEGLCLYCGKPGHLVAQCTFRPTMKLNAAASIPSIDPSKKELLQQD